MLATTIGLAFLTAVLFGDNEMIAPNTPPARPTATAQPAEGKIVSPSTIGRETPTVSPTSTKSPEKTPTPATNSTKTSEKTPPPTPVATPDQIAMAIQKQDEQLKKAESADSVGAIAEQAGRENQQSVGSPTIPNQNTTGLQQPGNQVRPDQPKRHDPGFSGLLSYLCGVPILGGLLLGGLWLRRQIHKHVVRPIQESLGFVDETAEDQEVEDQQSSRPSRQRRTKRKNRLLP